jgi:NAD(P)-dependent dehydrogenase (short-subunit alcohol dehydrogenase family)
MVEQTVGEFGRINRLANNAGIFSECPLLAQSSGRHGGADQVIYGDGRRRRAE